MVVFSVRAPVRVLLYFVSTEGLMAIPNYAGEADECQWRHLEIMNHEANSLGLQVSWYKTKIQTTDSSFPLGSYVPVAGDKVEVVESFTYLGGV